MESFAIHPHHFPSQVPPPPGRNCSSKKIENCCFTITTDNHNCNVYYAIIESHLRHAVVILGSLSKTKLAALQRLQDWACSIISNARIKDNWSSSWLKVGNLSVTIEPS